MIAIKTKLIPATDTKGTRIRATLPLDTSGRISRSTTISYDYDFDELHNHRMAAWALRSIFDPNIRLALEWVGSAATGRGEKTHLYRIAPRHS